MFITSVLLLLASLTPLQNREDIDQARFTAYDYLDQGLLDSAMIVMDNAVQSAKSVNYNYGTAKSVFIQSYLYRINNQLGKSFELNLEALKILESSDDERTPRTLAEIYNNTGEILIHHFKYEEAIQYFDQGLKLAIEHRLDKKAQNIYYNRGYAYWTAKDFEKATRDFKSSLETAISLDDEWMLINSHNMLGKTANDKGDFETARNHFIKIINHSFINESEEKYTGMAYSNIGKSYFLEGEIKLAQEAYSKAINRFKRIDEPVQLFNTQLALVELNLEINDLNQARYYGYQATDSYEHTILSPDNYRLFNLLTTIAFKQNKYVDAQKFYHQFVEENEAFIQTQKETIQLSEQYKMEMLTASFFKEIKQQEQMAQLNQVIYLLLGLGLLSFVVVRAKKYLLKRSLEQAFREIAQQKNLHF